MKTRSGWVANSSSSSFVVCSNNESFEGTLDDVWEDIFPAEGTTASFLQAVKEYVIWELEEFSTYSSWQSFLDHTKNDWGWQLDEDDEAFYKPLFEKWKYVHEVTINDGGCGGGHLESALRSSFPHSFENDKAEIKLTSG